MNHGNINQDAFVLRHNLWPNLIMPIIFLLLFPLLIVVAIKINDWSMVKFMVIFALIVSAFDVWFKIKCNVWFKDDKIFLKVVGGYMTMKINKIQKIKEERSFNIIYYNDNRPSWRISVYGEASKEPGIIDISLNLFKTEDVRKLMKIIHEYRPDLDMPKGWD